jgi:sigma-B regulation protein RsbU (phosphoserine phosphatase)
MFQDLVNNRDVASICFSNPKGYCTWLLHAHGRLELGYVDGEDRDHANEWVVQGNGAWDPTTPLRTYRYDALERPWFLTALSQPYPLWTPIYFWFPDQRDASVTGTGYTRAVRSVDGKLLGVMVVDVTLSALSDHLRQMDIAHNGSVFIVDEQGLLVAASEGAVNSSEGTRLSPAQSSSTAARSIAPLVTAAVHGPEVSAPEVENQRVMIDTPIGDLPARARVTEIKPFPGIHWHIVTLLHEESFLSKATSLRKRAFMLAGTAIAGGIVLGLLLSRLLSHPLMRLTEHVSRVGSGDFDARLHLSRASELSMLANEVNDMAAGLKQRMMLEQSMAVAEQIQQSLLPEAVPALRGLEVAACSRYCESTGGDYYDFIHVERLESHGTLVVVGDVTGHGLGAALLMSTARGAVRSACIDAPSLGHIMMRANEVLAGNARLGMFMTLALVFVNPETHHIHWASAGHDPAIIYHPDSGRFEELTSGDMPLGIEPSIPYREFSRPCATPGTMILIGTDGIWEARNPNGEMFGKERIHELMREYADSADALAEAIKRAMFDWVGPSPLQDDVTFVVIRVETARAG